jgi:hypothetical protein
LLTIFFALGGAVCALWAVLDGPSGLWEIDDLAMRSRVVLRRAIILFAYVPTGGCAFIGLLEQTLLLIVIGALTLTVVALSHRKARSQ